MSTNHAKTIQIHRQRVCESDPVQRRQMLTLSPVASVGSEDSDGSSDSPSFGRDEANIAVDYDLAVTHSRNKELRQRDGVKQFFAKLNTIESLWDQETRKWLGSLPYHMRREAIPLLESNIDGVFEDYQLHPSYSWLTRGKTAKDPDLMLYRLSCAEKVTLQIPNLFIPLGRLFVNAENGNRFAKRCNSNRSRLTRWTGYEIFISSDLAVWIVFDEDSFISHARPWYPVSSGITQFCKCGIARLLPSLSELEHATVEDAIESIKVTYQAGKMRIDEVEKSEVQKSEMEGAQTFNPLLPTIPSDTLAISQYTPSVGHEDVDGNAACPSDQPWYCQ